MIFRASGGMYYQPPFYRELRDLNGELNKNVRAQPYAYGSDEYVNLELYLAARGRGLLVETPAVRN